MNLHDKLKSFLEEHQLWGNQFRYGCADANFTADRELRVSGVSASQLRPDGTVALYLTSDSRDYYCNAFFFEGLKQIVIYTAEGLEHISAVSYKVATPSALVALVRPVMPA